MGKRLLSGSALKLAARPASFSIVPPHLVALAKLGQPCARCFFALLSPASRANICRACCDEVIRFPRILRPVIFGFFFIRAFWQLDKHSPWPAG
jgi:hypothetical protein